MIQVYLSFLEENECYVTHKGRKPKNKHLRPNSGGRRPLNRATGVAQRLPPVRRCSLVSFVHVDRVPPKPDVRGPSDHRLFWSEPAFCSTEEEPSEVYIYSWKEVEVASALTVFCFVSALSCDVVKSTGTFSSKSGKLSVNASERQSSAPGFFLIYLLLAVIFTIGVQLLVDCC